MGRSEREDRFRAWLEKRTSGHGERQKLSLLLRPKQRNFISKYLGGEPKTLPLDDAAEIVRRYRVSLDAVLGTTPPRPDPELAKLFSDLEALDDTDSWASIRGVVARFAPQPVEADEPDEPPRGVKGRKGKRSS